MNPAIELGRYRLGERIGEGGGGQVYRATGPDGPVAVKVLGPAGDLDAAARARLEREIAALQRISHPNLVPLLDHGTDAELGPYLVLPLLAGTNLRGLCAGRAICPEAALVLVQPIVRAVAALHAGGFVHRDLKPENVIAAPDGTLTVIDLGLAWADGMSRHTDTGTAVGSVGYMSPEQIEGRTVDDRTDVWALGVMIYELVAGKRPFARPRPAEEAAAALLGTCAKLTAADRRAGDDLAELVARCLQVEPTRRPSADELEKTIAALIDWTDDTDGERATVVADPAGYQARIAAFRIRRVERLARESIDDGKPFAALPYCDRGLAYEPEHAGLLALVAAAETATSKPRAVLRAPRRRWWIAGAALAIVIAAIAVAKLRPTPEAEPVDDPWATVDSRPAQPAAPTTTIKVLPDERDRKLMGSFINVFGKLTERKEPEAGSGKRPMTEEDRAMARDMVDLMGQVFERVNVAPPPPAK